MTPNASLVDYVRGWPVHLVNHGERFNPHVVAMGETMAVWVEMPGQSFDVTLGASLLAYGIVREKGARGVKLSTFSDAWLRRVETADLNKPSHEDPTAEGAVQWAHYDKTGWRIETIRHSLNDDGSVKWGEWAEELTSMVPAAPWLHVIASVARRAPTLELAAIMEAGVAAGMAYGLEAVLAEIETNNYDERNN